MRKPAVFGLVDSCDWLDSTSSALAGGKDADPTFGNSIWR